MKLPFLLLLALAATTFVRAQSTLLDSLVACYPFAGNAEDRTGNGFNGIVTGASLVANRLGVANEAYAFNGEGATYIDVANFADMGIEGEVSVSFWMKANQAGGNFELVLMPDDGDDRFAISAYYQHNGSPSIFWDFGDISEQGRLYIFPIAFVSEWQHFVMTSSRINNRMRIYKNGSLFLEKFGSSSLSNTNRTLRFGGGGNNSSNNYFKGLLDDVAIYNREVSAIEAGQLFQVGSPCYLHDAGIPNVDEITFQVSPNPGNGNFLVSGLEAVQSGTLDVSDALGQPVTTMKFTKGEAQVDLSNSPAGVYFFTVKSADRVIVRSVVKN